MYCAYITTIKELRKHNNADRLQCATIFGNNVIVDLSYKEGQRVIYFPVDGQLGEDFAKENTFLNSVLQFSQIIVFISLSPFNYFQYNF